VVKVVVVLVDSPVRGHEIHGVTRACDEVASDLVVANAVEANPFVGIGDRIVDDEGAVVLPSEDGGPATICVGGTVGNAIGASLGSTTVNVRNDVPDNVDGGGHGRRSRRAFELAVRAYSDDGVVNLVRNHPNIVACEAPDVQGRRDRGD